MLLLSQTRFRRSSRNYLQTTTTMTMTTMTTTSSSDVFSSKIYLRMTMTKTTTSSPALSAAVVVVVLTFMDSKCVFERMLPSTTRLFPASDGIQLES
jgi:hypothetical protein